MIYKLYKTPDGKDAAYLANIDRSSVSFIFDKNNTDYIAYLAWIAEGNTPEEA